MSPVSPFCRGKGGKSGSSALVLPEEPRETFVLGAELVSGVSQAICVAGAYSLGLPVYQHIAKMYNSEVSLSLSLSLFLSLSLPNRTGWLGVKH